jgi:hypothetical protein
MHLQFPLWPKKLGQAKLAPEGVDEHCGDQFFFAPPPAFEEPAEDDPAEDDPAEEPPDIPDPPELWLADDVLVDDPPL